MKRILLIIPGLDFGGAQMSFLRLSRLLKPYCDLRLVVFNKDHSATADFPEELIDLGVPSSSSMLQKVVNFRERIVRLKWVKREFRPEISISFLEGADYVNILSSVGESVMLYLHGSKVFDKNISGITGWIRMKILIPWLYQRADWILVVNERIAVELQTQFQLRKPSYEVMPNFFDFDEIMELAGESVGIPLENYFERFKVICISGRIAPEKGIDRFVRILPDLLMRMKDVRIAILGDGPEKERVQRLLTELNIAFIDKSGTIANEIGDAPVVFFGYQPNPYKFLGRSQLLALPSQNEGMPNTIVEAMGLGIPVVASHCPYGPGELLSNARVPGIWPERNRFGVLLPLLKNLTDEKKWVDAICEILSDSVAWRSYSNEGLIRSGEFSAGKVTEKWRKLLSV